MWEYLFSVIRYSLIGGEAPKAEEAPDWEKLYRICRFHRIEAIVCYGLDRMPDKGKVPQEIYQKFQKAWQMEAARDAVQSFSKEELFQAFEKEGVFYLPLKGLLMKQFYPEPELRTMGDFDILFRLEQEEKVDRLLLDLGYKCEHKGGAGKDNVYFRKPFMNIEMHHGLIEGWLSAASYYDNPWKRAVRVAAEKFEYRFSWEDFYIYMIVHLAKHFQHGGSGIRSLIDIWLFERQMGEALDWEYVHQEMQSLNLEVFTRHMRKLTKIWFEEEEGTEFYDELTAFMVRSGTFGTIQHAKAQRVAAVNKKFLIGQIRVWMSKIFPEYIFMKHQYPYLKKCPFLLPVAWVQRIFRTIFKKRGQAGKVLSGSTANMSEAQEMRKLFAQMGLLKNQRTSPK